MSEFAIKVENLSKVYKLYDHQRDRLKEFFHPLRYKYHQKYFALKDLSFEVQKGEKLSIIGKNGSGKSTLLKIIAGIVTPTTGKVNVNGRVSALLELGAGFNPDYTGIENVYLNGAINGYSKAEINNKLDEILGFADIGEYVHQPVKTYSSGMFIRLAFAVAINVEPDIFIVDEALSVGDIYFQAKCMTRIEQMMNQGITVLFVSHKMETIRSLFSKCLYLKEGVIQAYGDSGEITDMYLRDTQQQINERLFSQYNGASAREKITTVDHTTEIFKKDDIFQQRVALFRIGTGEAIITTMELLDASGEPVYVIESGGEVVIRLYVLSKQDFDIDVAYYIRDNRNIKILSSSILLETGKLISVKTNDQLIIDFRTILPLQTGNYNILLRITNGIYIKDQTKAIDQIENAYVFKVWEQKNFKLESKLYLVNTVTIRKKMESING